MELITVATVPYTGTHSIMELIDSTGYKVYAAVLHKSKEYRRKRNTKKKENGKFIGCQTGSVCHSYLGELAYKWEVVEKKLDSILEHPMFAKDKENVVHGHITPEVIKIIQTLSEHSRVIVPVRDPLLTLISCHSRNTNKRDRVKILEESDDNVWMEQQIESWRLFAEEIDKLDPLYVPIDLKYDIQYNGFNFNEIGCYASHGNYPLKQAYYNRDLEAIKEQLGEYYDKLVELEPILRPVLERIGYRGLMWWSGYANPNTN